ncbi:hypothetical protein Cgig2_013537 [Carnegiea gigantea]|uniref:Uncharacterized protein n=1 Tax=Carnegiea gigantea TaxID=171969 RepID=A0A9Q1JU89_9CARY|nr:hypothetical protein Cgig2_013537 [Carnegiea gigantea]
MQKKIESFFKPPQVPKPRSYFDELSDDTSAKHLPKIRIKYTRGALDSRQSASGLIGEQELDEERGERKALEIVGRKEKVLNKKRNYAQFHLELGQSDFLLHTCKICGIKYAKGDKADEKVHSTFHKNYTLGIPFKGWRHGREIDLPTLERDRIILVLNSDPPAQRKKVQEVVKMMEIELGDGWVFHEHIKVYLFISSQRIAGCMVVEPITTAHRILSSSVEKVPDDVSVKDVKQKPGVLQFGEICFHREVAKKYRSSEAMDSYLLGSTLCEEEATPASCGVRAIWVSPSNRRKHIATHLLDAVSCSSGSSATIPTRDPGILRQSFDEDHVLEPTELAFSQPTSAGKALASKYTGTKSFLVY